MRLVCLLALAALGLATGCTGTISGNPLDDLPKGRLGGVIVQGLQDASFNLDSAVTVGALAATDPAPPCFHSVLGQIGADPTAPMPPGQSFTPKVSDLISAGSVLYIRAQQAKAAQRTGVTIPPPCKVLITDFLLDAAALGVKGFPGGGLAIPVR